ncbi:MAG: DUF2470 domain-containing protein [Cardiobacteriaceae bacterium]|nr:DUF2470 domain-containing protein [Cardiobacteriaceae bacterium]
MKKDFAQERENPYTTAQAVEDVRSHMLDTFAGSLATICRDDHPLAAYPVSSVVPFFLDDNFQPIILIADIAEHTHNALANPKASIFLREGLDKKDVQTQWRICMIGDLLPVGEEEAEAIGEQYYAHFPGARGYNRTHGFRFFRLNLKKYRIIMGFGAIRWVKAEAVCEANPFAESKYGMIRHMNEDHESAMRTYLRQIGVTVQEDKKVEMANLHQYGCTLRHGDGLHFVPFAQKASTAQEVREMLVAMAKA